MAGPKPRNAAATRSFRAKHEAVYASDAHCTRYDEALCRRQDHAGELLAALQAIVPNLGCSSRVADVGAGTGKLSRLLAPHVASIILVDRSSDALSVARGQLAAHHDCAISFCEADMRTLPLANESVDLVIVGWAVSYLKSEHEIWHPDGSSGGPWRDEVDRAMKEFDRVLAPGGTLVILETMGTAVERSQRSGSWLYAHYRAAHGLQEKVIRTDYSFPSKREALQTLSFFFGRGVAQRAEKLLSATVDEDEACIVPECTGMWWRTKNGAFAPIQRTYCESRAYGLWKRLFSNAVLMTASAERYC